MDKYSHFINFCLLASFIHTAPDMTAKSRNLWSWIWLALAILGIVIQSIKGASA